MKDVGSLITFAIPMLLLIGYKTYIKNERLANDEYKQGISRYARLVDTMISIVVPLLASALYFLAAKLNIEWLMDTLGPYFFLSTILYCIDQIAYSIIYKVFSKDRSYSYSDGFYRYYYTDTTRKKVDRRSWILDFARHLGSLLVFATSLVCFGWNDYISQFR